ncbi:YeeE/YedE thiosulfate transporter family protein [Roseomonas fluvialis]|nr:YeeE/YedE thiosulfate transporter family protein [Roseomonas fluvialis]
MSATATRAAAAPWPVLAAALLLAGGAAWFGAGHGWRQAALWALGAGLGVALYHATFSFAGGFRALLGQRRSAAFRAQLVMLAILVVLMLPAIDAGSLAGAPVRGIVFPLGVAVVVGAFLFGVGMQLGGGCGSGTLYTAGGGSLRMLLTLAFFVAGATLAAWQSEAWSGLPALPAATLPGLLGLWPAVGVSLALLAAAGAAAWLAERRRHGAATPLRGTGGAWLHGPWPLLWGAVALALLNLATLWLAGRPWVITAAFPLWGSRVIEALGLDDPAFWAFWEDPTRTEAFLRPVLADRTTVMDVGLMAGALLAAGLAGRFAPRLAMPWRHAVASVLGGLLLGVGAVVASGCNISAYVAGIASGSLHGWGWIIPALAGNWVGMRLRPAFGLPA